MLRWLKNKLKSRSVEQIVRECIQEHYIEYDPAIAARFYNTECSELGFTIYNRFSSTKETDQELAQDIVVFMKEFYPFIQENKDRIKHSDFLRFTYLAFQTWTYIVNKKIKEAEEEDSEATYLHICWNTDPSLKAQIKKRITPKTTLLSIDFQPSSMVLLESYLKKQGFGVEIDDRVLKSCENKNIEYMIKKYFSNIEKP